VKREREREKSLNQQKIAILLKDPVGQKLVNGSKIGPGANFINILQEPFFVRKRIEQLSLVTFQLFNFWRLNFVQKTSR